MATNIYLALPYSQKHLITFCLALTPEKPQYYLVEIVKGPALIHLMYVLLLLFSLTLIL